MRTNASTISTKSTAKEEPSTTAITIPAEEPSTTVITIPAEPNPLPSKPLLAVTQPDQKTEW